MVESNPRFGTRPTVVRDRYLERRVQIPSNDSRYYVRLRFLSEDLVSLNCLKFDFISLEKKFLVKPLRSIETLEKLTIIHTKCFHVKLIFAKIRTLRNLEIQYRYSRFSTNPRKKMLLYIVPCRLIDLCSLMVSSDYRAS